MFISNQLRQFSNHCARCWHDLPIAQWLEIPKPHQCHPLSNSDRSEFWRVADQTRLAC